MTKLIQLPKDWKRVKVSSIAELFRGINYTKDVSSNNPFKDSLPILRGNNINVELNFDDLVYVPKTLVKKEQFVYKDDIIFAMSSGSKHLVGKSAVAKNDFYGSYGAFCALLRISGDVNKKYISYVFKGNSYRKLISEIAKGTSINNLKREHILDFELPLPPKPTQQAIVSKIEELFSELDKGIEQLKTAQQQLKTYRQSVLKWAFEGKLTNENVKEGKLPEGWESLELGKVCSLITDGKHGDCENEENSGYYFLSAKDVRNNTLLWKDARQITKTGFEETHRRTNLKPGDICLVNTGATIGRISIAPDDERTFRSTFQKSVAVIKCIPSLLDNKYVKYLLQGDVKKLVKVSSGTAVPNLLLGTLKGHLINLPSSLDEQNIIVQEIESRLSVADKMEESITQSLQRAEGLRQSILKKAFEGRLV